MVSEKQTTTEPKGATCHGKRSTKSAVVSKVFREDVVYKELNARTNERNIFYNDYLSLLESVLPKKFWAEIDYRSRNITTPSLSFVKKSLEKLGLPFTVKQHDKKWTVHKLSTE